MDARFNIVFEGELVAGCAPGEVQERLEKRFRMPADKVAALFGGGRFVLKKNLSRPQAERYRSELQAAGLGVFVEDAGTQPAPPDLTEYRVLFSGSIRPGSERDQVRAAAGRRLKLGKAQLDKVFSGRPVMLKRGLDQAGARRYRELLGGLGMEVRVDPPLPAAPGEEVNVVAGGDFGTDTGLQRKRLPDAVDERLAAAVLGDFEVPAVEPAPAGLFARRGPAAPSQTDLTNATRHMAATMLNADALSLYQGEIEAAEARGATQGVRDEPRDEPRDAPPGDPPAGDAPATSIRPVQPGSVLSRTEIEAALAEAESSLAAIAPGQPWSAQPGSIPGPWPDAEPVEAREPEPGTRADADSDQLRIPPVLALGAGALMVLAAWLMLA